MIKDLLAIVDDSDKDDGFLNDAIRFAADRQATLSIAVLAAIPYALTVNAMSPWGGPYLVDDEYLERAKEKARHIEQIAARAKYNVEIRMLSDDPTILLERAPVQARYTDLVLMGPHSSYAHPWLRRRLAENIAMQSGRPVLLMPAGKTPAKFSRILVGWNASREANVALHAMLPWLEAGAKIDVLIINPVSDPTGHGSEPGADIARHLLRHGFEVEVHIADDTVQPFADIFETHIRRTTADALVVGAYAHSRFRETLIGGVTRDLLDEFNAAPVLMMH